MYNMSELRDLVDEVIPIKDVSLQKILNNLLNADVNLELKTHIFKPKQLSVLVILGKYLKANKLENSYQLLKDFVNIYLKHMISYKRLSRIEIIKAISSIIEKERLSNTEKLTSKID